MRQSHLRRNAGKNAADVMVLVPSSIGEITQQLCSNQSGKCSLAGYFLGCDWSSAWWQSHVSTYYKVQCNITEKILAQFRDVPHRRKVLNFKELFPTVSSQTVFLGCSSVKIFDILSFQFLEVCLMIIVFVFQQSHDVAENSRVMHCPPPSRRHGECHFVYFSTQAQNLMWKLNTYETFLEFSYRIFLRLDSCNPPW